MRTLYPPKTPLFVDFIGYFVVVSYYMAPSSIKPQNTSKCKTVLLGEMDNNKDLDKYTILGLEFFHQHIPIYQWAFPIKAKHTELVIES